LAAAQSVPSLQPFFPVAPALAITQLVVRAVQARLEAGWIEPEKHYHELLALLAVPERTGLGPTHIEYTRLLVLNARGALEAAAGVPACLEASRTDSSITLRCRATRT